MTYSWDLDPPLDRYKHSDFIGDAIREMGFPNVDPYALSDDDMGKVWMRAGELYEEYSDREQARVMADYKVNPWRYTYEFSKGSDRWYREAPDGTRKYD